jgi:hypothetical protein
MTISLFVGDRAVRARRALLLGAVVLITLVQTELAVSAATPLRQTQSPVTRVTRSSVRRAAGGSSSSASAECPVDQALVPSCGVWWGEAVPNSGTDLVQAVALAEWQTQRPLDIVHTYHRWFQSFPTPQEAALARSGHILLINWQPTDRDGAPIPWAAIADGSQDAVISAEAERLAAFHSPVMISFSHEPEADVGKEGSAADFAAAYRRVHDVTVAAGATNVIWVWDVEGIATRHWLSVYRELWPGTSYVDWIAWDPYNFASCKDRPWRSFRELVTPFYKWLSAQPFRSRPLMLAELGTVGNATGAESKQAWYAGMRSSLRRFPRIKAIVYFDYASPPASCDWASNSSPAATTGFAALARDPVFVPAPTASSRQGVARR